VDDINPLFQIPEYNHPKNLSKVAGWVYRACRQKTHFGKLSASLSGHFPDKLSDKFRLSFLKIE